MVTRGGDERVLLVCQDDVSAFSPDGGNLEIHGVFENLYELDGSPWDGPFGHPLDTQSTRLSHGLSGSGTQSHDFPKVKGTGIQQEADRCLGNNPTDKDVLVLSLEETSHAYAYVLTRKLIVGHDLKRLGFR